MLDLRTHSWWLWPTGFERLRGCSPCVVQYGTFLQWANPLSLIMANGRQAYWCIDCIP